jgi:hypothetical protein
VSNVPGMAGASWTGVAGLLSIGLGGAIVPKRIDASCFAEPPVGWASSSDESSFSESAADHSSSSGRRRDCGPVKVDMVGCDASC